MSDAVNHESYDDAYLADILATAKVIALVGASTNVARPSYAVMGYLLSKGYVVHPVNPGLAGGTIHGQQVYARLVDVPAPVDMVDIFRNSQDALPVTQEAIRLQDALKIRSVWMQIGVRNHEAAAAAEAAGLAVVMNHCPKIEYARLSGEIAEARRTAPSR